MEARESRGRRGREDCLQADAPAITCICTLYWPGLHHHAMLRPLPETRKVRVVGRTPAVLRNPQTIQ